MADIISGTCRSCGGDLVCIPGERTYHPAASSDPAKPCPALLPIEGAHPSFGALSSDVPEDQFIDDRRERLACPLHDGHGPLRCHPGCPAHASFMAEMHDQMRPQPVRHEAPAPDDWPIEGLLRAHHEVERWARERGLLAASQRLVVEVRATPLRPRPERFAADGGPPNMDGRDVFGVRPKSAIVIHHGEDGWT